MYSFVNLSPSRNFLHPKSLLIHVMDESTHIEVMEGDLSLPIPLDSE